MLKADYTSRKDSTKVGVELNGIQIFVDCNDVPAFNIVFKIKMEKDVDNGGQENVDFFYSTFKNDSKLLRY